jgi:hypothetical protein
MTREQIIALAEIYLNNEKIRYVKPGQLGESEGDKVEVIFLKPEAFDPDVVIDPPDVRMWVNTKTEEVTWIFQM